MATVDWLDPSRPKLPPGALFAIADDLLADIYTIWLLLKDMCRLDSALCSKRWRPPFLRLISTKVLLFLREEIDVLNCDSLCSTTHRVLRLPELNWILKRGIHLASLRLSSLLDEIEEIEEDLEAEKKSICVAVSSLVSEGRLDKLETIDFHECFYIKDAVLAAILSKSYNSVKSIDIRRCMELASSAAHIKRCTRLEAFVAAGKESATDMVDIVQSCRKLRKLNLSCFGRRLTDDVVQSVSRLLEYLYLGSCFAVSDAAFRRVAESCPLLQFVYFDNVHITDATVMSQCTHCPRLKAMYFHGCTLLTDAAVLAVAERLPGLTHINLCNIEAITSRAVDTLVSKCCELKFIQLNHCRNINDDTLSHIAKHCSKLEKLYVFRCSITIAGLTVIGTKCSKLKYVVIDKQRLEKMEQVFLQQVFPQIIWFPL